MRVRQSTLGEADKCLRSLQYSLEHPTYHGGSIRAVGTGYHMAHEHFYGFVETWGWDPLVQFTEVRQTLITESIKVGQERFDQSVAMAPSHVSEETKTAGAFRWDDTAPDTETGHAMIESMVRAYHDGGHAWTPEFEVLGVEVPFSLPFHGDHTRDGSIDLVLKDSAGYIIGDDHKTAGRAWDKGKHEARKQNQSPWYTAALMELYPNAPGYRFTYSIMTYAGKFERRISDVGMRHILATERKAMQVVSLYEHLRGAGYDLPANPASTLCSPKWCDHWDICEHGAALD